MDIKILSVILAIFSMFFLKISLEQSNLGQTADHDSASSISVESNG